MESVMSTLRLLDLPFDRETSVAYIVQQLSNTGLHAARSFEIDSACGSLTTGICSHDLNSACTCQMVVLLVTDSCPEPVSIILHSYSSKTEIYIDETEKGSRQDIIDRIIQALVL